MTWFAISVNPSANRPAVRSHYTRGPRNGLKVTREPLLSGILAIEHDLASRGFASYMPVETIELIHQRTKKLIVRRAPLLSGYVFVRDPHDWIALQDIPGVVGALGSAGIPIVIRQSDIDALMAAEAENAAMIETKRRTRLEQAKRMSRSRASKALPDGTKIEINHPVLGKRSATVTGVTGRNTVKAMAEFLGGLVPVEISFDAVTEIAA